MSNDGLQGFATIPRSVLHDENLSTNAKMVYLVLSSHSSNSDAHVWPSHRTIARIAGLSVATVKRRLLDLREANLIEWDTQIGPVDMRVSNYYRLITGARPLQSKIAQPDPHAASAQQFGVAQAELGGQAEPGSLSTTPKPGELTQTPSSQGATNENHLTTTRTKKRGERIPDDWHRTPRDVEWQREQEIPDEFARPVTAEFLNHWLSSSSPNAWKLNWSAAWKVWMSREWRDKGPRWIRDRTPQQVRDFDAERAQQRIAARRGDGLASAR